MTALTPGPRGSSAPASMNTARSRPRSPCFTCTAVDPVLSPTTPWCRPLALPRYPSAADASRSSRSGTGLRRSLADSPHQQAESRSSSYGPGSHLPWLRTPPHGDALMFGYRPESACLTRTCTSLTMHARRRTSAPLPRRRGGWMGGKRHLATAQPVGVAVAARARGTGRVPRQRGALVGIADHDGGADGLHVG